MHTYNYCILTIYELLVSKMTAWGFNSPKGLSMYSED